MFTGNHLRTLALACALIPVLVLTACVGPFGGDNGGGSNDESIGTITLTLANSVTSQTLLPDIDMTVAEYRMVGAGPDG
ncbi:MAG: hypothetical protein MI724_04855 [Spirochaetales bacterium]|nr:hypothetical protein [Spirochaetales bacterium]